VGDTGPHTGANHSDTTIGSRRVAIKGEFVTEIPPFCDIIHIPRVSSRRSVDSTERILHVGDLDHT